MVISLNITAALLTVLLRSFMRKFLFVQTSVISSTSSSFLGPHMLAIGGVFCYLTRNRYRNWLCKSDSSSCCETRLRKSLHEHNRLLSENRISKAKLWLEKLRGGNTGNRRLRQDAILHLINESKSTDQIVSIKSDEIIPKNLTEQIPSNTSLKYNKNESSLEKPLRCQMQKGNYLVYGLPSIIKEELVRRTRSGRVYGIRDM